MNNIIKRSKAANKFTVALTRFNLSCNKFIGGRSFLQKAEYDAQSRRLSRSTSDERVEENCHGESVSHY